MAEAAQMSLNGWSPLCILIDDGHLEELSLGIVYERVSTQGISTHTSFQKCMVTGTRVWHISAPGLSMTSNLRKNAQIRIKIQSMIRSFVAKQFPRPFLHIYILVGVYDFASPSGSFINLTAFLNQLMDFLEWMHDLMPDAKFIWLGPGSWHEGLQNADLLRSMHASVTTVNSIRPYISAIDISLGMTPQQAGPYVDHWSLPFLMSKVQFLQHLFKQQEFVASDRFLCQELQLMSGYKYDPTQYSFLSSANYAPICSTPESCYRPYLEVIPEDENADGHLYEVPRNEATNVKGPRPSGLLKRIRNSIRRRSH